MSDITVTSGAQEIIASGIATPFEAENPTIKMIVKDVHFEFVFKDDLEIAKNPDNKNGIINLTPIMDSSKAIEQKITIINAIARTIEAAIQGFFLNPLIYFPTLISTTSSLLFSFIYLPEIWEV